MGRLDCFDKKIKGGYSVERLTGKVSLKVQLEEGKIKDISVFNNELKSSSFPKCLVKGVKKLEFAAECNEEVTIPFTFPPEEDEDE